MKKLTENSFTIIDEKTVPLKNRTLFTSLKVNAILEKKLGQCIGILMSILPIVVQNMKILKPILMPIFDVVMPPLIQKSEATCSNGLTRKVGK